MSFSSFNAHTDDFIEKTRDSILKFICGLDEGFELVELIFDRKGNVEDFLFLMVNSTFERQTGLKAANLLGKLKKQVAPASDPKWYDFAIQAAKTQEKLHYQYYNSNVNRYFETEFIPISTNQIAVLFKDITNNKQTQQALMETEERYSQLFNSMTEMFFVADLLIEHDEVKDFVFIECNPAFLKSINKSKADVAGRHAVDLFGRVEPDWLEEMGKIERSGQAVHTQTRSNRTGKYYEVYAWKAKSKQVAVIFEDITQRKALEKQLQEHERLAAIGATAGMVGHDIRNPLQAMIGDVYLLKSEVTYIPEDEAKQEAIENLDSIEKNIGYINKIVADLQDYSRPLKPDYTNVNLNEMVFNVLRQVAIPDNIKSSVEIDPSIKLKSDPMLISRILTNLIVNAIQAMPEGGKLLTGAYGIGDKVIIKIRDTGVGIPEHVKEKLFTPMLTTKAKGQGLGLAVVKRLVEALNGNIGFTSEEGKGAEFLVELPMG